jgi:hypothetical protein
MGDRFSSAMPDGGGAGVRETIGRSSGQAERPDGLAGGVADPGMAETTIGEIR